MIFSNWLAAMQIKPSDCPHCSSTDLTLRKAFVEIEGRFAKVGHYVRCNECGLEGPITGCENSAVYWWNRLSGKRDVSVVSRFNPDAFVEGYFNERAEKGEEPKRMKW